MHTARSLLTLAVALAWAPLAVAQAPAPAESAPTDAAGLNLDTITITGASTAASKMKQSVSISTLGIEQIGKVGATSAAEVLRSVPGVRSESSGGEGNANLTVRGVPISAGGGRYVQIQEDGLPILLFGDIAFGTPDQFLRVDGMLDRLEVVRGGSASTLASNSPGSIVNFIGKDGRDEGGSIGFGFGLGHREARLDVDYGTPIGTGLHLQFGGFQRVGDGGRDADGLNTAKGGQFRASLTKDFDAGFLRLNFKHLDDRTPTFLPVPVTVTDGRINTIPGIDPRQAFFITPRLNADTSFTRDGNYVTNNPRDGLHVKSNAIGIEADFKLGDGWKLNNKFRRADNSGRFIGLFPGDNGDNGNAPFFTGVLFNTSLDDLSNLFNDLRVSKAFSMGETNRLTATGGLFYGVQNVAQTWFWNRYNITFQGTGSQVVDADGNPTSEPVGTGWTTFGGCCVRTWDTEYTQTAPYLALNWEAGPFTLDASVRHDSQRANGWFQSGDAATETWDEAGRRTVDYKVSHTSYSVGGNFQLNRDLAFFARASDGVAYAADRLLYGKAVDGTLPIDINTVRQIEGGVKWRSGGFSSFVTLFEARTKESNYEATTQVFTNNTYKARGVELEAGWRAGDFRIDGGLTYTHARITGTADGSNVGNQPRRQADWTYQLTPSFRWGAFEIGAAVVGTTDAWGDDANSIKMPAFVIVNPYLTWQFNDSLQFALNVNNLFDKLGYTEVEGDGHAARAVNGRTARASLKYSF